MYIDGYPNPNGNTDVQVFKGWATVTTTQWQTWRRPPGKTMLHILCIGGGGGGGGGFTAAAAGARGGGGSGGSSGQSSVTVPLFLLPDTLFIQVGAGGIGVGSGGGTAGSGVLSYVAIAPNTTASNVVAVSGAAAAVGGGTGTGAAVGAAGTAGTIPTIATMPLAAAGQYALLAGQIGVAGGAVAGAVGTAQSIPVTGLRCSAGTGGAGTTSADFAGGLWTSISSSWLSERRPATQASGTVNGSGGPQYWKPFFGFGGQGGSASNTAAGGNGGNGAFGCGGGGGGGGTTGGRGGDGGAGIVIMTAY